MSPSLPSVMSGRSILVQLGLLLIICQLVAVLVAVMFIAWRFERPEPIHAATPATVEALAIYRLFGAADTGERAALASVLGRTASAVTVAPATELALRRARDERHAPLVKVLEHAAPDLTESAYLTQAPGEVERIALEVGGGQMLLFDPRISERTVTGPRIVSTLHVAMTVVPFAILAFWAVRMLTSPLSRLAASAERFAIDLDPTPMRESGPAELRKLAHAFNLMRERIRQLVESRSRMLAAVSHDLRTPLTRIRLRAEALVDGDDRARILRDVRTMDRMIGQALSYLRDQAAAQRLEQVDVSALIETICHDFEDMGQSVRFAGERRLVMACDPDLITRALTNVIGNAVKFGESAEVTVAAEGSDAIRVHVRDDGPGIAPAARTTAFEPFARGDGVRRSSESDGFGLGLAIARQIVERHGGRIDLENREPHGLDVAIVMPTRGQAGA